VVPMDRALQTVTSRVPLPILVHARDEEGEGWIVLPERNGRQLLTSVYRASLANLPQLRGEEKALYGTIVQLRDAVSLGTPKHLQEAIEAASRYTSIPGATVIFKWSNVPLNKLILEGKNTLSQLMNLATSDTSFVFWFPHNGRRGSVPAIFCRSMLAATVALDNTSQTRLCANAKCRTPFARRPGKVYCSERCGTAVRVRRLRKTK
jgi:hypothetical protein